MDAQILFVLEEEQHRVGDGADAQLEGGPVGDQRGAVLADGPLHIADPALGQLKDGLLVLHEHVDVLHRQPGAPVGIGHGGVYLGNDRFGRLHRRQGVVAGHPQRHPALPVGRGHADHRHIHRQGGVEQAGDLEEKAGGEIALPALHRPAGGAAHKQGVMAEMPGVFGQAVGPLAHGHHMDDLHVPVGRGVLHQLVH